MTAPWNKSDQVYIVAEIGNNHNGSVQLALEMIHAFADTGIDAVKFQTFQAKDIVSPFEPMRDPEKWDPNREFNTWKDFASKLELPIDIYPNLIDTAHACGVDFITTPTSPQIVTLLSSLGLDALKVASMDVTNAPLLEAMSISELPIIMSTGMATFEEVDIAVEILGEQIELALLHCLSLYPLEEKEARLSTIPYLKRRFKKTIGFSDHSTGNFLPVLAVGCGAKIIEKHVTLDKLSRKPGEHFFSIEPNEMRSMVHDIRHTEAVMGTPKTVLSDAEHEAALMNRRSVMSKRNMKIGDTISLSDLICLRPGTGLPPIEMKNIIGRKLSRDLPAFTLITFDDLE